LDILREFSGLRVQTYVRRKNFLVARLTRETEILSNKARFILMVVKGELELRRRKKAELLQELKQLKFTPMSQLDAIMKGKTTLKESDEISATTDGTTDKTEYDYLLNMNLWSLTFEKVEEIRKQLEVKKEELEVLKATTIETMWDRDLEALSVALDDLDKADDEEAMAAQQAAEGRKRKRGGAGRGRTAPTPQLAQVNPLARAAAGKLRDEFLDRPLKTAEAGPEVQKVVWGSGATPTPASASRTNQPAPPKRLKLGAADASPSDSSVDLTGAGGLLSRLMNKQESSTGVGSEDLLGNLKVGGLGQTNRGARMESTGSSPLDFMDLTGSAPRTSAPSRAGLDSASGRDLNESATRKAGLLFSTPTGTAGATGQSAGGLRSRLRLMEPGAEASATTRPPGAGQTHGGLSALLSSSRAAAPQSKATDSVLLDSDDDVPLARLGGGGGGGPDTETPLCRSVGSGGGPDAQGQGSGPQPAKRRRKLRIVDDDDDEDFVL